MRWKLELQEFDFDIEYLRGEDNLVADNCSRLMDKHPKSQDTSNTSPKTYKTPKDESRSKDD